MGFAGLSASRCCQSHSLPPAVLVFARCCWVGLWLGGLGPPSKLQIFKGAIGPCALWQRRGCVSLESTKGPTPSCIPSGLLLVLGRAGWGSQPTLPSLSLAKRGLKVLSSAQQWSRIQTGTVATGCVTLHSSPNFSEPTFSTTV